MDLASLSMLMAMSMKASGSTTKHTEEEHTPTQMEHSMKETGSMINNTDKERKAGRMVRNMKEPIKKVRNMAMGGFLLPITPTTRASS